MINRRDLIAGGAALGSYPAFLKQVRAQSFSAAGSGVAKLRAGGSRVGTPNVFTTNAGGAGGGTATQFQQILFIPVANAASVKAVILEYANVYNATGPQAVDPGPSDLTLTIGIWQPTISNRIAPNWQGSGSPTVVLAPGARDYVYVPITIPVAAGGFYVIIFARYASLPAAWPVSTTNIASGDAIEFGTALTDKTMGPQFFGSGIGRAFMPPLNAWTMATTGNVSAIILGDSVSTTGNVDSTVGYWTGWAQKAFGNYCPVANIGASGMANFSLWQNADERARHLGPYLEQSGTWSHFINCMGGNDLKNGQTQSLFKGNCDRVNAAINKLGMKQILCTTPPLTDAANTMENPSYPGSWANRTAINTWIRTDPYGVGFLDVAAQMEGDGSGPVLGSNLWRSDTGFTIPADGNHPPPAYHSATVSYITPLLPTILV